MAIQPRFRVYDYFHIYWSNFKILFYACVVEGCSASLTIAREKQTSNIFHLRWSSVENRVSRDVLTGKVYSDSNFIACNVKSLLKAGDKIILVTMDRGRLAIEVPYIHIFVFTHRKNNQFQNRGGIRIYEYGPPQLPIFRGT